MVVVIINDLVIIIVVVVDEVLVLLVIVLLLVADDALASATCTDGLCSTSSSRHRCLTSAGADQRFGFCIGCAHSSGRGNTSSESNRDRWFVAADPNRW